MERFEDLLETQSLAKSVVGAAMKVHRTLGSGFLELVYANALAVELERQAVSFKRECRIAVRYEGQIVGDYIADFVICDALVVELKAVETLTVKHSLQLVNYLAATGFDVGLLLTLGAGVLSSKRKLARTMGSKNWFLVSALSVPA